MSTPPVLTMSWAAFINGVRHDAFYSVENRLKVIQMARNGFAKHAHFSDMTPDEQKCIAGVPNALNADGVDCGLFGSMKGAGVFRNRINVNDATVSRALDAIPLFGELTRAHYDEFLLHYQMTFQRNFIATATRLLAMKRPDTFVCLDSKNRSKLCKAFGIPQTGMTYDRYWQQIVLQIRNSEWCLHRHPASAIEQQVSEARAAFLDAHFYVED
jgi:hypothetical protein